MGYKWDWESNAYRWVEPGEGDEDLPDFGPVEPEGPDIGGAIGGLLGGAGEALGGFFGGFGRGQGAPGPSPTGGPTPTLGRTPDEQAFVDYLASGGKPDKLTPGEAKISTLTAGQRAVLDAYQRGASEAEVNEIKKVFGMFIAEPRPTSGENLEDKINLFRRAYGREPNETELGKMFGTYTAPPSIPQGRDLGMSDYERAMMERYGNQDLLDWVKFGAGQEKGEREYGLDLAKYGLEGEKFDYQRLKDQAQAEHQAATLAYQQAQAQAEAAFREAQLTQDREYKAALIENARAQLAESKRQFEVTEARLRRAQAVAEAQTAREQSLREGQERQRATEKYIELFGYSPSWARGAPKMPGLTQADVARMGEYGAVR